MAFVAVASVVASVASTVVQYQGQKKAAKAQKEQIRLQQQQAEVANVRETREMVRNRYRQSAGIQQAGATAGVSSSSGVAGGISSLGAQMASNVSYMSEQGTLKAQEFGAAMNYAKAQQLIGYGQALGGISSAMSSGAQYFKKA